MNAPRIYTQLLHHDSSTQHHKSVFGQIVRRPQPQCSSRVDVAFNCTGTTAITNDDEDDRDSQLSGHNLHNF